MILGVILDWVNYFFNDYYKHDPEISTDLDVNEILKSRNITIIEENKYEFLVNQEEHTRVKFIVDKIFNSFKKSNYLLDIKDFFKQKFIPEEKDIQDILGLHNFEIKIKPELNNESENFNQLGLFYKGDFNLKKGEFIPAYGTILTCDEEIYFKMNQDNSRGIIHSIPICRFKIENDIYYSLLGVNNAKSDEENKIANHDIGIWYFANYTVQDSEEYKDLGDYNCVCKCVTINDKLVVGLEIAKEITPKEELLIYTHTDPIF